MNDDNSHSDPKEPGSSRSHRVFIGLTEIVRIAEDLKVGLEANGHAADIYLWQRSRMFPNTPSFFLAHDAVGLPPGKPTAFGWLRMQLVMLAKLPYILNRYDLFVLIYNYTILPGSLDLLLLRLFGKKVVRIWCGTDIRYWHAYEQEMRCLGMEHDVEPFLEGIRGDLQDRFLEKVEMVRMGEWFSNLVYAQASYAQLLRRPYMRLYLPMAPEDYPFHIPDHDVPLVVHAPSHTARKGTREILDAIERLHAEGLSFEFRLMQNCTNEEVRAALFEADIIVDQLISAIIGKFALEGMSSGCAVLGRYAPNYAPIPPGCPMISVTAETITDRLREVILDRNLRKQLAIAGRQYVEAHYDRRVFAEKMLNALTDGPRASEVTVPSFYRSYRPSLRQIGKECSSVLQNGVNALKRIVRKSATP